MPHFFCPLFFMKHTNNSFLWGAATSSYQIEGAVNIDGRSPSIWDTFCATPGKISDGSSGAVACDHYNRLEEDVGIMQRLGLQAYRFSIAWPRILPEGVGKVNDKGLDLYERLLDYLLAADILPFPTLYHWDLPQVLQDKGGWTNPDISHWFAEYTQAVVRRLGDRVKQWTTLNEPHVFTLLGHLTGSHAPGHTNRAHYFLAMRNALLAHGRSSLVLRSHHNNLQVGIANCWPLIQPLGPEHEVAANHANQLTNRIWFDPLYLGKIPEFAAKKMEQYGASLSEEELRLVHNPPDFVGLNYYMRMLAKNSPDPDKTFELSHPRYPGAVITDIGWEVYPQGLSAVLEIIRDEYGNPPVYITENGASYGDGPDCNGVVRDLRRVEYYQQHLQALENSRTQGCAVAGYFAWSLLDNFEWAKGYQDRFGLVHVDYANKCRRTIKQSGFWYSDHIARTICEKK